MYSCTIYTLGWKNLCVAHLTCSLCLGYKNEGWFDPWLLLSGFKSKAISLGVDFFPGEVTDINVVSDRVASVKVLYMHMHNYTYSVTPFLSLRAYLCVLCYPSIDLRRDIVHM